MDYLSAQNILHTLFSKVNVVRVCERFMEVSYDVPFGKKSKRVTRAGVAEAEEQSLGPPIFTDAAFYQCRYPSLAVGHASRKDLTKESDLQNYIDYEMSNRRLWSFDGLDSPLTHDDLPHPSKLRNVNMERPTSRSKAKASSLSLQDQCHDQTYICTTDTSVLQTSLSISNWSAESPGYLHGVELAHPKEHITSKPNGFPPGSVPVGCASLEQEEERWFRQLWKPRNKAKYIEE